MLGLFILLIFLFSIPSNTTLVLDRETLVGIFNGSISSWDDPALANRNSFVLPKKKISVVYRSGSSGTTEIFTSTLSTFSSEYKKKYGIVSTFNVKLNGTIFVGLFIF